MLSFKVDVFFLFLDRPGLSSKLILQMAKCAGHEWRKSQGPSRKVKAKGLQTSSGFIRSRGFIQSRGISGISGGKIFCIGSDQSHNLRSKSYILIYNNRNWDIHNQDICI